MPADPTSLCTCINEQIEHLSGELAQHRNHGTVGGVDAFPTTAAPWQLQLHSTPVRAPLPPPPSLLPAENDTPFTLRNIINSPPSIPNPIPTTSLPADDYEVNGGGPHLSSVNSGDNDIYDSVITGDNTTIYSNEMA